MRQALLRHGVGLFFAAVLIGLLSCALPLFAQSASQDQPQASNLPASNQRSSSDQKPESTQPSPAKPQGQETPAITIRQTVTRVIVDVMVRDAIGKPVHGLTAKDFALFEDKQPQPILSFDVFNFDTPSPYRAPNSPPLPANVFVNLPSAPEHGPLYVILYDMLNMEMDDQAIARQQVLKFIRSKPEGTRFAVFVLSDELRLIQGFTDNKDELYAAMDPKHPKAHIPRIFLYARNYGHNDPYTIVDVLTHIGQYLDGIPGRKNLIWLAGSFPLAIGAEEANSSYWQADVKTQVNALAQAQIAVFPLNVRGVVVNPEGALTGGMPHGGVGGEAIGVKPGTPPSNSPGGGPVMSAMEAAGHGSSVSRDYASQETIAAATGGRAIYSDNDLSSMLADATEDGGNYYRLTYSPPSPGFDGKCHNIGVKLAQSGYQLSFRRYYCRAAEVSTDESGSDEKSKTQLVATPLQAGDVLQANMKQGAPMVHDLIFSAHPRAQGSPALATPRQMEQLEDEPAYFRTPRKNKPLRPIAPVKIQTYVIDYRVLDPQFRRQVASSGKPATLEFAVAAFDIDGKVLNGMVNDGILEAPTQDGANKKGLYLIRQSLDVPVSAVAMRVGVRDKMSERIGTLEVKLPLAPEPASPAATQAH
jgi:VWFA-related protein